jgi:hypothetical protein
MKKVQKERVSLAFQDLEYLLKKPWTKKGVTIEMLRKARSQIQLALKNIKNYG